MCASMCVCVYLLGAWRRVRVDHKEGPLAEALGEGAFAFGTATGPIPNQMWRPQTPLIGPINNIPGTSIVSTASRSAIMPSPST